MATTGRPRRVSSRMKRAESVVLPLPPLPTNAIRTMPSLSFQTLKVVFTSAGVSVPTRLRDRQIRVARSGESAQQGADPRDRERVALHAAAGDDAVGHRGDVGVMPVRLALVDVGD